MINLDILNPPQKEAVLQTDGPVLVLAGAGSGKTRVLTYRLAYILDTGLAGPLNILAMTFTNKAAGEMKDRIAKLLENNTELQNNNVSVNSLVWMGTFHSICVKILRIHGELVGLSRNFVIYDSTDQKAAVKEAMKRLNIAIKDFNPNAIHSYISSAKNELISPSKYGEYAQGYFQKVVAQIYPVYQAVLKENNAVDFDDLLSHTVSLFLDNKEVLEKFQKQFKYILVDEYQDTNHVQYMLVKMLAHHYRNLCCVGDDDQSIYAFRGATIKNILNFEKDYPEATVIKLEQNYRSTQKILDASHFVISKNKNRKEKKLWTDNDEGENILVYKALDEINEGNWIVEKILESNKNGISLDDIAILYRTNAQSRALEESFINSGVPYKIIGGTQFYDRKEVKDVIAYLRLLYNPKDNTSLERVINVPKRGIGNKTIETLTEKSREEGMSIMEFLLSHQEDLSSAILVNFTKVITDVASKVNEKNLVQLIEYLLDKTGYIAMLKDGSLEGDSRIENIKELISVATRFESDDTSEALENFLNEVSLLEGVSRKSNDEATECVTLMTIHAAKGLEFEYIFIVGMEENLFPHSNSLMDQSELEEERRLAYVAITRAKRNLFMTHTARRKYFGRIQVNPLSRFVNDIDSSLIDFVNDEANGLDIEEYFSSDKKTKYSDDYQIHLEVGDRVKHEYFGKGEVRYLDDGMVVVDFGPVYGKKELLLEYARLEKIVS